MAVKPLDDFLHNQVIREAKLDVSNFDTNLKTSITDFNKRYQGYKLKESPATLEALEANSRLLAQHIYDYYVDKDDQEANLMNPDATKKEIKEAIKEIKEEAASDGLPPVEPKTEPKPEPKPATPPSDPAPVEPVNPPAPPEPTNKNEKALYLLFIAGVKEGITRAMLREKGFDLEKASIRGCRVGAYNLHKNFSDTTYKLDKI